jgi:hypothetical protein
MHRLVLSHSVRSATLLTDNHLISCIIGAVDSTIVKNVSLIEWIEVVPFEPIGTQDNVTSYLEWAVPISTITVSTMVNSSSTCVHGFVHRLGVRPLRYSPHILRQIPTSR